MTALRTSRNGSFFFPLRSISNIAAMTDPRHRFRDRNQRATRKEVENQPGCQAEATARVPPARFPAQKISDAPTRDAA
jgi:hypothetical protein